MAAGTRHMAVKGGACARLGPRKPRLAVARHLRVGLSVPCSQVEMRAFISFLRSPLVTRRAYISILFSLAFSCACRLDTWL